MPTAALQEGGRCSRDACGLILGTTNLASQKQGIPDPGVPALPPALRLHTSGDGELTTIFHSLSADPAALTTRHVGAGCHS